MAELMRDNLYRAIRQAILSCEFWPGQELREQVLAEKYRVSRSPVRDALLRLHQEKLVTVMPRQGYRINPILLRDVEELIGLRLIVAPACAAEAAKADGLATRALDRFRVSNEKPMQEEEFLGYDRDFHSAVANLAGNRRLAEVELALIDEFVRVVLMSLQSLGASPISGSIAQHNAIIDAIQAHDSDAAYRRVHDHVARVRERILAAWRDAAGQEDRPVSRLRVAIVDDGQ